MRRDANFSRQRRILLKRAGTFALPLACGLAVPGGCARRPADGAPPGPIRLPLSELPPGGRLRRLQGDLPIEVRRSASGISARSLLCTHFGCEVYWVEGERSYHCPCHEGRFDAEGRPIAGPPTSPLETIPAVIEGETVVVGA